MKSGVSSSAHMAMDCLRLLALVLIDLIRPPRPENRLPCRWLARGARPA